MLRLAVIRPTDKASLYMTAMARTDQLFEVTHVVGDSPIGPTTCFAGEDELVTRQAYFDACVVHADVSDCLDTIIVLAE